jgi:hypothetical protein
LFCFDCDQSPKEEEGKEEKKPKIKRKKKNYAYQFIPSSTILFLI